MVELAYVLASVAMVYCYVRTSIRLIKLNDVLANLIGSVVNNSSTNVLPDS